jgi:translocation and assembly module TamB
LRALRRLFRGLGWAVLTLVLLCLLVLLPLLSLMASADGSRWLIGRALGMQQALNLEVEGGNLLDGLRLRKVHMRGLSYDLYINRVVARWTLASLLRGQVQLDQLRLEQFRLVLKGPVKPGPVHLAVLRLPFQLNLVKGEVIQGGIDNRGHYQYLDRLTIDHGHWFGTQLTVQDIGGSHRGLGELHLHGAIHFEDQYPISAAGQLQLEALSAKGLGPVQVKLDQDLGRLALVLDSAGRLPAHVAGTLQTLEGGLPFHARATWGSFALPWLAEQGLSTTGGKMSASGSLNVLDTSGSTTLTGKSMPKGQYDWNLHTDWEKFSIKAITFKGMGGTLNVAATVVHGARDWSWQAEARLKQLNLAQKWPASQLALPVLSGNISSQGHAGGAGSQVLVNADLANGERWSLRQEAPGWPWHTQDRQRVELSWLGVQRELPGLGPVSSADGTLHFDGSLASYRLNLDAELTSARIPHGEWHAEAQGQGRQLVLQRANYEGDIGTASFAGRVELGSSLRWQGALALGDVQTGWLLPAWPGQFSGSLEGQGSWGAGGRQLTLDSVHLRGQLRDKPIQLDGGLHLQMPAQAGGWPQVTAQQLQGVWGQDQFLVQGGLEQGWQLRVDAKLHDLALLDARLAGQVDTQFTVTGPQARPSADLHLDVHDFSGFRTSAKALTIDGHIAEWGNQASSLRLTGTGLSVLERPIDSTTLTLSGNRDSHELQYQLAAGRVTAAGKVNGHIDAATGSWDGSLSQSLLHLPGMDWTQDGPATLAYVQADHSLHIGQHCWSSGDAHLCNMDELLAGPAGHARLRLTDLDAARLQPWLPEGMSLQAKVSGNGDANWQAGELPEVSLNLLTHGGSIVLKREEEQPPLQLGYSLIALSAFIRPDSWRLRYDMLSPDIGNGYADVTLDPRTPAYALSGNTSLQGLQLEVFRAFLPALSSLSGQVSVQGGFSGLLRQPQFSGQVKLVNGQLTARDAPVNLHDINIVGDVQGRSIQLQGQAGSGKGVAELRGEGGWGEQPHLNLAITGRNFEVRQAPMVEAMLDPDLNVAVVPGQVTIKGQIKVPYAKLDIKALPEKATPLSADVVVVSEDTRRSRVQLAGAMQGWLVDADIDLLLGEDVNFRGFGVVNGHLGGNLHLQQHGKRGLQAAGQVELQKNARYEAYGQKLDITRGILIFAGPLTQPGLDLEASKVVDAKTVGIRVTGRANAPQVEFFSDSDLSQSDIVSYIILGRPLYQNGQLNVLCNQSAGGKTGSSTTSSTSTTAASTNPACAQGNASASDLALATAAIKLGSSGGGEGLAGRIGGVFGIQDVAVGAESTTDDTQFTVSGYVNPKLYLSYGVGVFTPVNTVKVRYNITPRLYLQAVSTIENAIDIYYNFKF